MSGAGGRRAALLGLAGLAVVALVGTWRFHTVRAAEKAIRDRGLRGTAELAAAGIGRWLEERRRDADYVAGSLAGAAGVAELARFARARGYDAAWLVSGDGRAVAALDGAPAPDEAAAITRFRCRGGDAVVPVFDSTRARIDVLVMRPLSAPAGACRDAVVLRADLTTPLLPYIRSQSRLSTTGTSFIAARLPGGDLGDVVMLVSPRNEPMYVRRLPAARVPTPIAGALAGWDSVLIALDHAGTRVHAAVRGVAPVGWGVVRQIEEAEYMRLVWTRALTEAGLTAALLLLVAWAALAHRRAVRIEQLDADLARIQLDALRAQLQPHFLFNVLNGIGELIHADAAAAEVMLQRLARLLRFSLATRADREVPLREELEIVRAYADIEQVRFGAALSVEYDVRPDVEGALVPPFLLQPLVENAVKHGLRTPDRAGRVGVAASREGDRLRVTVSDNGRGPAAEVATPGSGFGLGLATTRRRLERLYGAAHDLRVRALEDGGTEVELRLPLRE